MMLTVEAHANSATLQLQKKVITVKQSVV